MRPGRELRVDVVTTRQMTGCLFGELGASHVIESLVTLRRGERVWCDGTCGVEFGIAARVSIPHAEEILGDILAGLCR